MRDLLSPFIVGLVTLGGVGAFVWMVGAVKGGVDERAGIRVYAVFDDASGLVPKSRVEVAGINVGEIERIELSDGRAKVALRVTVPLYSDAAVVRKQASLLGDYMLQLRPGSQKPQLKDGDEIRRVVKQTDASQLIERLEEVATDIKKITATFEKVLGGDKGEQALQDIVDNLAAATRAVNDSVTGNADSVDTIIDNVEAITDDVRGLTGDAGESVNAILRDVHFVVKEVKDIVGRSKGDVNESIGTLKGALAKLQDTLDRLSETVAHTTSIARKIDEGDGTLGKLVNDGRIAEEVGEIVADTGDFVHSLAGLQTLVGLRSDYNFGLNSVKNYLSLRFQPREDKYYLLEIIDDPRGTTKVTRRTLDSQDPQQHQIVHETETLTTDEMKFSLQFAKEYYFLTGRFGIIESSGGMGANIHLLNRDLDIAIDLFDFGADQYPRLRISAAYEFFKHMYVIGGLDDMINVLSEGHVAQTFFLGASLRFTDHDLKALLTTMPTPSF